MKRVIALALLLACCLTVWSCGGQQHYGLSDDRYVLVEDGRPNEFVDIVFEMDDEYRFVFSYDGFSSYRPTGIFTIDEGKVTCVTDDGKYTFIFEIVDNDTLRFVQDGSSELKTMENGIAASGGAIFKRTED